MKQELYILGFLCIMTIEMSLGAFADAGTCPTGWNYHWNAIQKPEPACISDQSATCPQGFRFVKRGFAPFRYECVVDAQPDPICPSGTRFAELTGKCDGVISMQCPSGDFLVAIARDKTGLCATDVTDAICPSSHPTYEPKRGKDSCRNANGNSRDASCPSGFALRLSDKRDVIIDQCYATVEGVFIVPGSESRSIGSRIERTPETNRPRPTRRR